MMDIAWELASLSQLAMLLEASAPKPGNVNRTNSFSDTGYRHFLASASFSARCMHTAAERGVQLARGDIEPDGLGLGEIILGCTHDCLLGLNRSNTVFGSIMLHVPLVTSSAAAISETHHFSVSGVEKWLKSCIDATTVSDAVNLIRALQTIGAGGRMNKETASWTSRHDRYDIDNPLAERNIVEDGLTLRQLLVLSGPVDEISREWSEYFKTTLREVYSVLDAQSSDLEDMEEGIVRTFLWLLSKRPDGLIVKKRGVREAERVRMLAERIVSAQTEGKDTASLVAELDHELRARGNTLNPGATADIVSAAILCKLLRITFA